MKKVVFVCFLALMSVMVQAQKVKKEVVGKYHYTQLPLDLALVGSESYSVEVSGDGVDGYQRDKAYAALNLEGFKELDKDSDAEGDFVVKIEKYSIQFGDPKKETSTKTVKKDGVEKKVNVYKWSADAKYKFTLSIRKDGEEVYSTEAAATKKVSGNSSESSSTAYDSFKTERNEFRSNIISAAVNTMNTQVNDKYCFPDRYVSVRSATIKPKKHNYDDYDGYFASMLAGYQTISADENAIEAAKPEFEKAIQGFEEILTQADFENKKARVNEEFATLLYNNIGHCYLLMKDYPKAMEYYTKCTELKKSFLDAKYLAGKCEDLQKRVEVNATL